MARLEGGALPEVPQQRAYETIARAFHEAYERLAPEWGYKTREASAVPWEDVPAQNRCLMMEVVAELLDRRIIRLGTDQR